MKLFTIEEESGDGASSEAPDARNAARFALGYWALGLFLFNVVGGVGWFFAGLLLLGAVPS